MKIQTKKNGGIWLIMLLLVGVLLGLWPNKTGSFATADPQLDAVLISASDTDASESEEEDDDEWEA